MTKQPRKKDDVKKTTKKVKTTKEGKMKKEKIEETKEIVVEKETKNEEQVVEENKKEKSKLVSIIELIAIIIFIVIVLIFFKNTVVWNIVVLLLMLTILIFVHEFGHFIAAKKFGVHVYEFSLGMGPQILRFKRKNDPTEYSLRALPIGGYCQMAGEEGEDDEHLPKDKFMCNKGKLQRTIILAAGVTMNFITAFILLLLISGIWGSTEQRSIIGEVEKDSPAEKAGIVAGDEVVELNGHKVSTWDEIQLVSMLKNDKEYYTYKIEHEDGTIEEYQIIPDEYITIGSKSYQITKDHTKEEILDENDAKESDKNVSISKKLGVKTPTTRKKGIKNAFSYACIKFKGTVKMMYTMIGALLTGKLSLKNLSGPVGMYTVVGEVAKYGLANILFLMAYLSINLAVMNFLPFPAFDGGRVVFVIIEAITGKKVNPTVEGWFHTVGFALLMLLSLYITFQDVLSLI